MIRLLSLIFILFFTNSFADDIFIGPCSLNAENRDDCLRFKVNKLIELTPRMRDKNDEFPTDNLEMKDIQSDIGNGNISILSLKFEECMSFKVLNFRTEFDKDQKIITAYLGFNVQLLKILSTLDVDFHFIGEMSQFRDLKTKGKAQAIFENVNADMIIKTDVITENDFSFLSLVDLKGNLNCPSLKLFDFNFLSEPKNRFHNVAMNTLIKEYFYKLCDIFVNNYSPEKSPNDEVVCILGTKSLNNCVKTVMTKRLANLHNPKKPEIYDTIDPFLFDHAKLSFNESDKFHGSFSIKNVLIEGGSKINFKRIAIKRHKMMMKILGVIHIPEINVDGLFKSNLRIDTYLFKSDGNFTGTIEDLYGKFVMSGKLFETDDGLLQFKVENFHIFFIIIDMNIHLYGKQIDDNLSLIIDRIINESWQYVYQDLIARSRFIFGKVLQLKCLVL